MTQTSHTATAPTLDPARISQIAQIIRTQVSDFMAANASKTDFADALKDAAEFEGATREATMMRLADLSQTEQWSEGEIGAAAAGAANMSNDPDSRGAKALATFIAECKRAMHPRVRAHVPAIVALRDAAWAAETLAAKADKGTDTPLRKAWARAYHMLLAMFGAMQDGRVLTTVQDVYNYAAENDPDLDPKKVAKRLERIRENLASFYRDFPVDDIKLCVDTLMEIDTKRLKAARPAPSVRAIQGVPATVPVRPVHAVDAPDTAMAQALRRAATERGLSVEAADTMVDTLDDLEAALVKAA